MPAIKTEQKLEPVKKAEPTKEPQSAGLPPNKNNVQMTEGLKSSIHVSADFWYNKFQGELRRSKFDD